MAFLDNALHVSLIAIRFKYKYILGHYKTILNQILRLLESSRINPHESFPYLDAQELHHG